MATRRKIYKKIFISWSGDNSKQIARALKDSLENTIFKDTGLECFVSDVDISSGDDWWNKIKTELKKLNVKVQIRNCLHYKRKSSGTMDLF